MKDYIIAAISSLMDCFEDFASGISVPTAKYTSDAFLVSLAFLVISVVSDFTSIWCFVSWQESVTCSVLLLLLSFIDTTTRHHVKKNVASIKEKAKQSLFKLRKESEVSENESGNQ